MMKIAFTSGIDEHIISKLQKSLNAEGLSTKIYYSESSYLPDESIAFYTSSKKDSNPELIQLLGHKVDPDVLLKMRQSNILVATVSPELAASVASEVYKCITNKNYTLSEINVGVVGFGEIGSRVGKSLLSKGIKVSYFDICTPLFDRTHSSIRRMSLDLLLTRSDVITLHARVGPTSKFIISNRELSLIRKDSLIINFSDELLIDADCGPQIEVLKQLGRYISFDEIPEVKTGCPGLKESAWEFAIKNVVSYVKGNRPEGLIDYIDFPPAGDPSFWSSRMINL